MCGVIYGSLRPASIILKEPNKTGTKLDDFTCARLKNSDEIQYSVNLGYTAPEVILGYPRTMHMDMFSYGCTIFELVYGKRLFADHSEQAYLASMAGILGAIPEAMVNNSPNKS